MSERRHRGASKRIDAALIAVADEVTVRDFGALHALSGSTVRGLVERGLPHFRYPGRITIPRVEGAAWLQRFRAGAADALVSEVLADLAPKPLADASRRLRAVRRA